MENNKKKIAVICAYLPGRNTGMVTVDLAAHTIVAGMFPEAEVTLYTFSKEGKQEYKDGDMPHQYLDIAQHSEQFLRSDVFLYWGDFIHSRSYWVYDMGAWNDGIQGGGGSPAERALLENRSKYIFLSLLDEVQLKKAIVFGSTIITNDATDEVDTLYTSSFQRFFSKIGAVLFRDALSSAKVSPLRGHEATLGCDCAILLQNSDLNQLKGFKKSETQSGVGVFFGRSPSKLHMLIFSKLVGSQLGEACKWIPWFPSSSLMRRVAGLVFGYEVNSVPCEPGVILSQMSACRFIVTDTYHLCVNAWRMGIPAICIGEGASGALHSLADKKKEILYEMYGGRHLYVFLEKIRYLPKMLSEAERVAKIVQDEKVTAAIAQNIQNHRRMALSRLEKAVREAMAVQ